MEEVNPPGRGPQLLKVTPLGGGQLVLVSVPMICGPGMPAALTKLLKVIPGGALLPQL